VHPMNRLVIDTNVFVSAVVLPLSVPRRAVDKALDQDIILLSEFTARELREVLSRTKFDRYINAAERELFLAQLGSVSEFVPIIQLVRECRDPKDDKFLEVALNGRAGVMITGDADLLKINPWREIPVLSVSDYLAR
jgi:uncharacterized protein